jgi:hypothetical protein
LRYTVSGADMFLEADTTGDAAADFRILLSNFSGPLAATDFVL